MFYSPEIQLLTDQYDDLLSQSSALNKKAQQIRRELRYKSATLSEKQVSNRQHKLDEMQVESLVLIAQCDALKTLIGQKKKEQIARSPFSPKWTLR